MRKLFTIIAGFSLFVCVYIHVKRQSNYIATQPVADAKTVMQTSPVNTFATNTKASLAISVVANQ